MPGAMEYSPDLEEALRDEQRRELLARRTEAGEAMAYYEGKHKANLKVDLNGVDDNVTINLCEQAVDRTVAFMVPEMPKLEISEARDTADEAELAEAIEASGGAGLVAEMAVIGALDGHVVVRVLELEDGEESPQVICLDPANVTVWWKADNWKKVLWYEIAWQVGKTLYRQDIVDLGGVWAIYEFEGDIDDGQMKATSTIEWNYPLGPIIDWPHLVMPKRYYGRGELRHRRLNDSVNKITSDERRIIRFHASPKTVGIGFKADKLQKTAIEGFFTVENKDAQIYNLEMKGDLEASERVAERLKNEFKAQSRVVILSGSVADFQRVTNLGVRVLFWDQISKNNELWRNYSKGIEKVCQRVRMLMGKEDFKARIKVIPPDPLPQDPLEAATVAEKKVGLGVVSTETVTEELGENYSQEQERINEQGGIAAVSLGGSQRQPMVQKPVTGGV